MSHTITRPGSTSPSATIEHIVARAAFQSVVGGVTGDAVIAAAALDALDADDDVAQARSRLGEMDLQRPLVAAEVDAVFTAAAVE